MGTIKNVMETGFVTFSASLIADRSSTTDPIRGKPSGVEFALLNQFVRWKMQRWDTLLLTNHILHKDPPPDRPIRACPVARLRSHMQQWASDSVLSLDKSDGQLRHEESCYPIRFARGQPGRDQGRLVECDTEELDDVPGIPQRIMFDLRQPSLSTARYS